MAMLRCGSRRLGCLRAALRSQAHHRSVTFCIDRKARLGEGRAGLWWASLRIPVSDSLLLLGFVLTHTPDSLGPVLGSLDGLISSLCPVPSRTRFPLPYQSCLPNLLPPISQDLLPGPAPCGLCDRLLVQSSAPSQPRPMLYKGEGNCDFGWLK